MIFSLSLAAARPIEPVPLPEKADTFAFGSCAYSRMPDHRVWSSIHEAEPDVLVLLGDNVYGDTEDPEVLERTLARLGRRPRFQRLTAEVPVLHTWDDHDYGENDSDMRHNDRDGVRQVTLDFFGAAPDDIRRTQAGGIYKSVTLGRKARRVQMVVLDTRWDLSPREPRMDGGVGRYAPGVGNILGEAQWSWLERTLKEPAQLRIIVSSIPFSPSYTGWESWANFPLEQQRMVELLEEAGPVLVVSGDVHYAELSKLKGIVDFTTSGLAGHAYPPQPNDNRVDELAHDGNNFGMVHVDWKKRSVRLRLLDRKGELSFEKVYAFDELDPE